MREVAVTLSDRSQHRAARLCRRWRKRGCSTMVQGRGSFVAEAPPPPRNRRKRDPQRSPPRSRRRRGRRASPWMSWPTRSGAGRAARMNHLQHYLHPDYPALSSGTGWSASWAARTSRVPGRATVQPSIRRAADIDSFGAIPPRVPSGPRRFALFQPNLEFTTGDTHESHQCLDLHRLHRRRGALVPRATCLSASPSCWP